MARGGKGGKHCGVNMKQKFSHSWRSSKQPRKQRKFRHHSPLNIRRHLIAAHLSRELRKKHSRRNIPLRKGDTVKVMRGQFRKKTGKIERILLNRYKVYVAGAERTKKDGSKSRYPIDPSNLLITELNLEDKKRNEILKRKHGTTPVKS